MHWGILVECKKVGVFSD